MSAHGSTLLCDERVRGRVKETAHSKKTQIGTGSKNSSIIIIIITLRIPMWICSSSKESKGGNNSYNRRQRNEPT